MNLALVYFKGWDFSQIFFCSSAWSCEGELDLSWNDFTGPIPSELGRLENLRTYRWNTECSRRLKVWNAISVSSASLNVPFCRQLSIPGTVKLDLSDNRLTGPVPTEFGRLENLGTSINCINHDVCKHLTVEISIFCFLTPRQFRLTNRIPLSIQKFLDRLYPIRTWLAHILT